MTAPIQEWSTVGSSPQIGAWAAAGSGSTDWLVASQAPNATYVSAYLSGLTMGSVATVTANGATSRAAASNGGRTFSPNGDRRHDALRITYLLAVEMASLTLNVHRASDLGLVGSRELPGLAAGDHAYDWDGQLGGARVPDGTYVLQLVGVRNGATYALPVLDLADPTVDLGSATVRVDTRAPTLGSTALTLTAFSPNGDGVKDATGLRATAGSDTRRWAIHLVRDGSIRRSFRGTGGSLAATWDGRDANGGILSDGSLGVLFEAVDGVGNLARVSRSVTIDTLVPAPQLTVRVPGIQPGATANAFSPDGDGVLDVVDLGWSVAEDVSGTLEIRSASRLIWTRSVPPGRDGSVRWDARDSAGRSVADGRYTVVALVSDRAGNRAVRSASVIVDRAAGFLNASPRFWHPADGDALAARTTVSFRLTKTVTMTLRVVRPDGTVVRTAWSAITGTAGTHHWTWNGRDADGRLLPQGVYYLNLITGSGGVRQVHPRGMTLRAFAIYPSATRLSAGQTLTVSASSAEPLDAAPTITFGQLGLDPVSKIASRRADGRWAATFRVAAGGSGRATIRVAGRDTAGGSNRSTIRVRVD